jgi:hypothetical protein
MTLLPAKGHPSNCRLLIENASINFDKRTLSINPFTIEATPQWRITAPATSESINISGVNFLRKTTESYITDYTIISKYANAELCPCDSLSITSLTPQTISSPNSNNVLQGIEPGIGLLEISDEDGNSVEKQISVAIKPSNITQEFVSYLNGSLAYHITNNIDGRIRSPAVMGLPTTTTKPVFSTYNTTAPLYVRNTNCWAYGIDLTPISPWNSTHGLNAAGTLISPRHVLFVEHFNFHPSPGATIHFVDNNNNVVIRTVISVKKHPSVAEGGTFPDITIGVLNEDVPSSISFAKILPDNYINYLPGINMSLGNFAKLPVYIADSPENALISDFVSISNNGSMTCSPPPDNLRLAFHETMVTGDSGSPMCFIIDNSLVILGTVTWSGAGAGTATHPFKNDINQIMTDLGGGYQLTEIDLSSFPSY